MGIFDCDNSYIIENKQYKCEITVVLKAIIEKFNSAKSGVKMALFAELTCLRICLSA